jgi:transposase
VDALGNPLCFTLTAGQRHDITQAVSLTIGFDSDYVLADRGYDADEFVDLMRDLGRIPVIPPKKNRKQPREYDKHLYKERHLVECFMNKIKHYRHLFSRFDKLASRYLSFLQFASALIWLR